MKKNILILAASLLSSQAFAIQEIPDTNINEAAISSIENGETVIRYNPEYCETLGEQVCHFFISHEYGHIALQHPLGGEYTEEEENAADCWVTQNAPIDLSKAAYAYFTTKDPLDGDIDSAAHRAKNISECPRKKPITKQFFEKNKIANHKKAERQSIQERALFDHSQADAIFFTIESGRYGYLFTRYSSYSAVEYIYNDWSVGYIKEYYNGSGLMEYQGGLYYKIFGGNWIYYNRISSWFF
jgi:hypothetical protein